jgi:hypothetical protein
LRTKFRKSTASPRAKPTGDSGGGYDGLLCPMLCPIFKDNESVNFPETIMGDQ